jgi:putative PIN family toxin of toxin-antitoxin system
MKIVLDTNVLVAAFATQGLCHALVELCLDQQEIVLSQEILLEVARALEKKLKVPAKVTRDTIDYLKEHGSVQKLQLLQKRISRDPSDDHVLALAEQSGADYIITGDEDLLILKRHNKTPIVQPRQFWEILKNKEKRSR